MSKILKVKIKREQSETGTHYVYPLEYDAQKIQVIAYESIGQEDKIKERGNKDEYCIGVVKDEDAANFLKSNDIEELDEPKAIELGSKFKPQITKIHEPNRVLEILSKQARGGELNRKEINELDPEIDKGPIRKSTHFSEVLKRTREEVDRGIRRR